MIEIDSNKHAWGQIAEEQYCRFKESLSDGTHKLNKYIEHELGDLSGKKIIHLQCNTGADTILLAQMGASAVGVDLVPDNILYADKLADDLNVTNISFIESDIMRFMEKHNDKYDVVFVSEGAIGWLPDLKKWGKTIRHLLKDDGFFYIFDSHPIFMIFDEEKLVNNVTEIKYPYFDKEPDIDDSIGGYAGEAKHGVQSYFWMHTISDIINALTSAGLHIEYFNEFRENYFDAGGMQDVGNGLFNYDFNDNKFPMSFSLKASVYLGCRELS
jgi:SAM-dependent methyltransferase